MIEHPWLAVSCIVLLSFFISEVGFARGILGDQPGDRSPEQNVHWLKSGIQEIRLAIQDAEAGNLDTSIDHAKNGMGAIKEISSEGWDGKRQRSVHALRIGISAARKGEGDKACQEYNKAFDILDGLKYGDMNFTHESFLGIGDGK